MKPRTCARMNTVCPTRDSEQRVRRPARPRRAPRTRRESARAPHTQATRPAPRRPARPPAPGRPACAPPPAPSSHCGAAGSAPAAKYKAARRAVRQGPTPPTAAGFRLRCGFDAGQRGSRPAGTRAAPGAKQGRGDTRAAGRRARLQLVGDQSAQLGREARRKARAARQAADSHHVAQQQRAQVRVRGRSRLGGRLRKAALRDAQVRRPEGHLGHHEALVAQRQHLPRGARNRAAARPHARPRRGAC